MIFQFIAMRTFFYKKKLIKMQEVLNIEYFSLWELRYLTLERKVFVRMKRNKKQKEYKLSSFNQFIISNNCQLKKVKKEVCTDSSKKLDEPIIEKKIII